MQFFPRAPRGRVKLIWLAKRDPFAEADRLARERIPETVYDLNAWEVDFIRELVAPFDVAFVHRRRSWQVRGPCDILVYSINKFKIDEIRPVLRRAKPRVVFHLSDEWGDKARWHEILRHVPLVLRQHHFSVYPNYANIKPFPLGYMEAMLHEPSTDPAFISRQKPMRDRQYAWSFIGNIKDDRAQALEAFADLSPNHVGSAHPADMAKLYLDSKFVLSPIGNVSPLCFRHFEASICGAIPIIAGCSAERYRDSLGGLGNPPWVFHESWGDAHAEVTALLEDDAKLEALRLEALDWWRTQVEKAQCALRVALDHVVDRADDCPPPVATSGMTSAAK